jgi:putative FmdB family regulatory protein
MIYDYRCKECGEVFEIDAPMGNRPDTVICPICDKEAKRFIISAGALVFDWGARAASEAGVSGRYHAPTRSKRR